MSADSDRDLNESFSSDLIDLGEFDLAAVRDLPGAVLRAAVERVRAELADGRETVAFFQSSVQDPGKPEDHND
jgi:FXSXX-COOH protein